MEEVEVVISDDFVFDADLLLASADASQPGKTLPVAGRRPCRLSARQFAA